MKKFLAILMAALMLFSITACTSSNEPAAEPSPAPEAEGGEEPAEEQLTLEAGKLLVAISPDFAPMEFVATSKTGQAQYVGFDVTLSKFIAEQMGLELEIKPMSFDACQAAVQTNTVDMSISGFSYTPERAENFNLSDYYYAGDNETEQTIIVLKEDEGKWTKPEDYSGLTIAAQTASLQMNLVTSQLPSDCNIKEFSDLGTAVEALRSGIVDGVAVAYGNGEAIIASNDAIAMSGFEFEVSEEAENNVIMLNKTTTHCWRRSTRSSPSLTITATTAAGMKKRRLSPVSIPRKKSATKRWTA